MKESTSLKPFGYLGDIYSVDANAVPKNLSKKGVAPYFPISAMRAVGLITSRHVDDLKSDPVAIGCCILVGEEWVLAAHHVLPSHEFSQNFQVVFDYLVSETNPKAEYSKTTRIKFSPNKNTYYCSLDGILSTAGHDYMNGDWVLIKLESKIDAKKFKPLMPRKQIATDNYPPKRQFVLPHYENQTQPAGAPPRPEPLHVLITPTEKEGEKYFTDTHRIASSPSEDWKMEHFINGHSGASGAPLMDGDGKFVGMHVRSLDKDVGINTGLASNALFISNDLKNRCNFPFKSEKITLDPINF
nr:trypsin-like serine protease [uncultured Albidiferax sp.]